jgi:DNA-binding NarL/FixJ family response regulator
MPRLEASHRAEPIPARRIRILCVDDHRIVREGIAQVINRERDMEVVGLAASGEEALVLHERLRPDVTLMDLWLGSMSGVSAIRGIKACDPGARVIVLTMAEGDDDVYRALQAGAATYLLKDTAFTDLVRAIRKVWAGQPLPISADVRARLAEHAARPALTPREIEVLELIRRGLRNKEVAVSCGISEETVQSHVKSILAKLEVPDRTAAVDVALRRGIIHITRDSTARGADD